MRALFLAGAVNGFFAVALGAFGAHWLRGQLSARHLEIFEIGVRYHMYHSLAAIAAAWLVSRGAPYAKVAGLCFIVGIAIFSGSLYALALTGRSGLGAIAPLGGVAFLGGWGLLAYSAWRIPSPEPPG
jgi:uncharacterized membrane protein YgdD (TMEM256/DUF423 family)